jgi:multiple sugar transport system substrate-binding protein
MRRTAAMLAVALSALAISACGGSSGSSGGAGGSSSSSGASKSSGGSAPAAYDGKPVTISFWNPFTDRQLAVMNSVIAGFHKLYPNITVKSRGAVTDDNIVAAIRSGSPPDLTMSQSSDNLGQYCGSGAWINLGPYIARDHVDLGVMPSAVLDYTQFNGDRCALPDLADAYGLYYNKAMFAKAGITSPPKTFAELTQDAKKLTVFNPDGSIKVAGFVPTSSFYENAAAHYAPLWNAHWDENGQSSLATDPHWAAYLRWEKQLIDFYGASKLTRFLAGAGNEFSASNDFETGRIAMNLDGEWRVQFINTDHAKIQYGTAPAPVDPSQQNLYGGGYTTGNVLGIPKGAAHPAAAWLLAKYLAFNNSAIVHFADGLGNVPTITSALSNPTLVHIPLFNTFLKIFANPNTATDPITAIGSANQEMVQSFQTKWEDGSIPTSGLASALKGVDSQIKAQVANSTAGTGVP